MDAPNTILLVEDEKLAALDISRRLEKLGYELLEVVASGEQALRAVQEHSPSLVLMDIVLEGEMDGIQTAQLIARNYDIPVIYLTAHTDELTLRRARETGPFGYIVKPPETTALQSTIEMAFFKHRAERDLKISEERFRLLFQEMLNAFALMEVICDEEDNPVDFRFLEVNPAFEKVTGLSKEQVLGRTGHEVMPSLEPIWVDRFGEVALRKKSLRFENYQRDLNKYLDIVAYCPRHGQAAAVINDISEQKRTEEKLQFSTLYDALTNLPNRSLCLDRIRQAIERSKRRENYLFAVIFLDLDRFRLVNDSLGHVVGDKLLTKVADKLSNHVRKLDTVARVGADEFVLLLEEVATHDEALRVAQRVKMDFERPLTIDGHQIYTSASIGIVLGPAVYELPEELLQNANIAMNYSRQHGRARFKIFNWSMKAKAEKLLDYETGLREALIKQEFVLFFQPILALGDMRLEGFEALIRWKRNGRGLVPPQEFIPILEETGLIIPVGNWVLEEACRVLVRWNERFPTRDKLFIAVNLSARQFSQPDLVPHMAKLLRDTGINPDSLKVELTETVIMENPQSAVHKLRGLKELGINISVDDFGTGYSSLSYLQRFPLDTLKVDRSFVSAMDHYENLVIVRSVINLAHSLGLTVVAEGIETNEQLTILSDLECERGQGYLFSKPVEEEKAQEMIRESL